MMMSSLLLAGSLDESVPESAREPWSLIVIIMKIFFMTLVWTKKEGDPHGDHTSRWTRRAGERADDRRKSVDCMYHRKGCPFTLAGAVFGVLPNVDEAHLNEPWRHEGDAELMMMTTAAAACSGSGRPTSVGVSINDTTTCATCM